MVAHSRGKALLILSCIAVVAVGVSVVAVGVYWTSGFRNRKPIVGQVKSAQGSDSLASSSAVSAIKKRLDALEKRSLLREQPNSEPIDDPARKSDRRPATRPLSEAKKRLVAWNNQLTERIWQEAKDPAWETEVMGQLQDTLADPRFGAFTVQSLECGTTICRLVISVDSLPENDGEQIQHEFMRSPAFRRQKLIRIHDDGTREIHIARRGTNLNDWVPRPDPP